MKGDPDIHTPNEPRPCGTDNDDPALSAWYKIKSLTEAHGAPLDLSVHLFINSHGLPVCITDEQTVLPRYLKLHPDWYRGAYNRRVMLGDLIWELS